MGLLSGCGLTQWADSGFRVGPNYHEPAVVVAEDWIDSKDPLVLASPPAYADWWAVFQDPVVNDLVQIAFNQNLTLRQAGIRVIQARASRP